MPGLICRWSYLLQQLEFVWMIGVTCFSHSATSNWSFPNYHFSFLRRVSWCRRWGSSTITVSATYLRSLFPTTPILSSSTSEAPRNWFAWRNLNFPRPRLTAPDPPPPPCGRRIISVAAVQEEAAVVLEDLMSPLLRPSCLLRLSKCRWFGLY